MAKPYERKSKGLYLLRRLLNQKGRAKDKGDALHVLLTVGEIRCALEHHDLLIKKEQENGKALHGLGV